MNEDFQRRGFRRINDRNHHEIASKISSSAEDENGKQATDDRSRLGRASKNKFTFPGNLYEPL